VTITGLATSLTNGQSQSLTLSYTAPATGPVAVSSHIATTTSQGANVAPDTANGSTAIMPIADVRTTVSVPATANAGSTVNGTVTFSNNGPSTAAGVTYSFTITPGLGTVSFPTLPSGVTASYNSGTGGVNLTGMPGSLTSGQILTFGLNYTAPGTGPVAVNTTMATSTSEGVNAAPDTASGSTAITPIADVMTTLTAPASANAGSTVNVPITFTNNGPSTAAGVTYSASLPTGLSGVSCTGATCSYNSGTGAVTITGLAGSLTNGQTQDITLSYTAPATGPVAVSSTVGTTTTESNTANNTASGSTTITPVADLVITKIVDNSTPYIGNNVTFTVQVTNNGPSTSAGVSVSDLLPSGYSYVSSSTATGTYTPGTGVWAIGSLSNGGSASLTISATVLASGIYANTATATATTYDPTTPNTATANVTPSAAASIGSLVWNDINRAYARVI
jgi:uncharacterized repeat protein (TIGR01451 family)